MGAGASTASPAKPGSPAKRKVNRGEHLDPLAVISSPTHDCEEFTVTYSEWGELGLTLREINLAHVVVKTNEKSFLLGAREGAMLLSVNGQSVEEFRHHDMLQTVANAEWPKTLKFRMTKAFRTAQDAFNKNHAPKKRVDFYEASFNEPGLDPMFGLKLSRVVDLDTGEGEGKETAGGLIVASAVDPAISRGITVGSKLVSVNGESLDGISREQAETKITGSSFPITLKFHGPKTVINSNLR